MNMDSPAPPTISELRGLASAMKSAARRAREVADTFDELHAVAKDIIGRHPDAYPYEKLEVREHTPEGT